MSNEDKAIYISRQRECYKEFESRQGKSLLITEVCGFLNVSRDHAIQILNSEGQGTRAHPGPKVKYTDDLLPHLMCALLRPHLSRGMCLKF